MNKVKFCLESLNVTSLGILMRSEDKVVHEPSTPRRRARGSDVRFHALETQALHGEKCSASHSGHLIPLNYTLLLTGQNAGRAPERVWTWWRTEKPCTTP
jgi:hypothetical protein